ncbi:dienelactone hydrolase [Arthrobacter stackebrandtii]|uniref:Dienelactone hydrolase n=1 Tax=Arthrobacter stackebrandtii TaxID=272161 RepID=A0ABS4YXC6_9MICC|nr:dienelactone hydrolase family protein [Arthrobacter stackebrandtii]MBP2413454.1 dienelactone hydrolase [Arthrobacter stackebrandtii]
MGFCFGGTYAFALAVAEPRLAGAIPFYGHAEYPVTELATIACPVLAFYGADDARLMEALPVLSERMAEAGVDFRPTVFPGAGHAFFNDSNPPMYRSDAARASWREALDFLAERPGAL